MKYTVVVVLIALACPTIPTQAQTREIKIGQRCPDVSLQLINGSRSKLSDYKGKLVIIDFWGTYCSSCIKLMPKMDSLQQKYGDRIAILPVTPEDRTLVTAFIRGNDHLRNSKLSYVVQDKVLDKLFPHESVPHEVWIGPDGIVKAITDSRYVTGENIASFIAGHKLKLPIKKKNNDYDYNSPLLRPAGRNASFKGTVYYSSLSGGAWDGVSASYIESNDGFTTDSAGFYRRYYQINKPILSLYKAVLEGTSLFAKSNRFISELPSKPNLMSSAMLFTAGLSKTLFCYEAVMPLHTSKMEITEKLRTDLNNFFSFNGRFEIRSKRCLVITQKGRIDPQPTYKDDENLLLFTSINQLVNYLDKSSKIPILRGDTGNSPLNIQLTPSAVDNMVLLKAELEKYGLVLCEEFRDIQVFVVSMDR